MNKKLIFFKIYCIKKIIYNSNRNNKALKNKSGKSLDRKKVIKILLKNILRDLKWRERREKLLPDRSRCIGQEQT